MGTHGLTALAQPLSLKPAEVGTPLPMSDAKPRRTLQSNTMHTCYFSHLCFELRKAWSAPRMSPTKQKIVKPTGWMIINENIVFNASTCIIQY